jgi:probable HAF family extracellular repeat protein
MSQRSATVGLACVIMAGPPAAAQSFRGLGTLNGFDSEALGISADGTTVVGHSSVAFRWTEATGMVAIGPPNENSIAHAASADGSAVAGYFEPWNLESFRWTEATGPVPLGMAPFVDPGAPFNVAYAISGDGLVVVGTTASNMPLNSNEAFRWTQAGGFQRLNGRAPMWDNMEGLGTNADGSVVVGQATRTDARGWEAYRWTAATGVIGLGDLNGDPEFQSSTATAVTPDGSVVVGFSDAEGFFDEAFRWTAATGMVGLGALSTPWGIGGSQALAVSADGSVVVGWSFGDNGPEAVIWTQAGGMRRLKNELIAQGLGAQVQGWEFQRATGISADGRSIVGIGINPQGGGEAFLARLGPPAPPPCYANCDGSTAQPVLNVLDFNCFLNRFTAGDAYANCDGSTSPPALNVLDFNCFLNRFTAGCP